MNHKDGCMHDMHNNECSLLWDRLMQKYVCGVCLQQVDLPQGVGWDGSVETQVRSSFAQNTHTDTEKP